MLLTLCAALLPSLQRPMEPMGELNARELASVRLKVLRSERPWREPTPAAELDSLSGVWGASITDDGQVLVIDCEDGVVHVFDEQGERVALCVPPDPKSNFAGAPRTDAQGRVLVRVVLSRDPYVEEIQSFAPDGRFEGVSVVAPPRCAVDSPWQDASVLWGEEGERSFEVEGSVRTLWHRRPDLQPWRVGGCAYLADGRVVLFDRYVAPTSCSIVSPPAVSRAPDLLQYLFVFDVEGRLLERLVLPESPRFWGPMGSGRFVLLHSDEEGFWVVDLHLRSLWRLRLPESEATKEDARIDWKLVTRPDGTDELWIVERRTTRLFRYALPEG